MPAEFDGGPHYPRPNKRITARLNDALRDLRRHEFAGTRAPVATLLAIADLAELMLRESHPTRNLDDYAREYDTLEERRMMA